MFPIIVALRIIITIIIIITYVYDLYIMFTRTYHAQYFLWLEKPLSPDQKERGPAFRLRTSRSLVIIVVAGAVTRAPPGQTAKRTRRLVLKI